MTKCKNCGHPITHDRGYKIRGDTMFPLESCILKSWFHDEKVIVDNKLPTGACAAVVKGKFCGCTNPEPKEG